MFELRGKRETEKVLWMWEIEEVAGQVLGRVSAKTLKSRTTALLKLECVCESPRGLVKLQILIRSAGVGL